MLFHRASAAAAALIISALTSLVAAQCSEVWTNSKNGCTFDFTNPNAIFAYYEETYDTDGNQALGICGPDNQGFTAVCVFYFVGQANQVTATGTYSTSSSQPSTDVFPFSNVPATSLVPGAPVTCTILPNIPATYIQGFSLVETFTIAQSIPIPPVTSTTTVAVPTVAVTTTTSTSTLIQPTATTITPATVTATTATGTKTVLAKTLALTTSTITITQPVRTSQRITIATTTTTLSCLPGKKQKRASPDVRRAQALPQHNPIFARQDATTTETPTCNQPAPTTPTITATAFSTVTTSTSTETDVVFTTSTSTSTVTLPTPTSYLSVEATTTRTLTFTLYTWTILPASTVTQTKTFTNTKTVLPKTHITACGGQPATTTASPGTCSVVQSMGGCQIQNCAKK
ncbi:hypothetical protein BAUCODRAFT_302490 [Baudoinia panamericana UAMH 10762]|uniref:Uncharacterized protein n=1 Tax=Baudoinia panamericana (strain UAMH 10762) TaxID=717646 RepID=M2M538_BAUPA|nr:uncharacterized protein BAUCODRAFT_302490 [Baudoinia panamericana UAMH 10762]EMC91731.1 hypothetical protein BAUCODRAFT_302490 [Baudoinia panamericana UAMH 10762]